MFSTGVNITGHSSSNVLIRYCRISDYYDGAASRSSDGNTFENNVIFNNTNSGIELLLADGNTITGNDIYSNGHFGLEMTNSNGNTINSNNISGNGGRGISLTMSGNNLFGQNTACNNQDFDFYVEDSSSNSGENNTCQEPYGWDDDGTLGCTNLCYAETTSTTTTTMTTPTTTSTSTTLSGTIYCDSCANCSSALSAAAPGSAVYLTNDVSSEVTCIIINSRSQVTFDCQGTNSSETTCATSTAILE